jgi:hypothetical protein
VFDEFVGASNVYHPREADLRDDGAELPASGRDTVAGGAVASGEDFARYNERGGVGAEILEKVGQAVQENERVLPPGSSDELVVAETCGPLARSVVSKNNQGRTHDDEQDGEHGETHELNGLAAPGVDEQEGHPVPGNETGDRDDQVADGHIVKGFVDTEGPLRWGST